MKQVVWIVMAGLVAMAISPVFGVERTFTNNNASMNVAGNWDPYGVPGLSDTGIIGGTLSITGLFDAVLSGPPTALVVRTNGTISLSMGMTNQNIIMEGGALTCSGNRTLASTVSLRYQSQFRMLGTANNSLLITGLLQNAGADAGRLIITNASTNVATGVTLSGAGNNTYSGGTIVYSGLLTLSASNVLGTGATDLMPGSILYWSLTSSQASHINVLGGKLKTAGGALTFTNGVSVKGELEVDSTGNSTTKLGGLMDDFSASETGRLVKTGVGQLILSTPTNTYSGGTLIKNGSLAIAVERALGKGHVTVTNGGELRIGSVSAPIAEPNWPGWQVDVLSNGTVRLLSSSTLYTTNVIVRNGGHIDGYSAGGNCPSYDKVRIEGRVYLHRANATTLTYYRWYGAFSDGAVPGRLFFTGPSIATNVNNGFSGVNTYTGGTEIEDGGMDALPFKLLGNGRMPDVGEILVHTNGIMDFNDIADTVGGLAGVGQVKLGKAVVTVNEGVSPGTNSLQAGALTVTSTSSLARVTLASSSTNLFHIRMPGNQDQVVIQGPGGLILAGTIKIAGTPTIFSGTYTLFDLSGGPLLGTIPSLILPPTCTGSIATNSGDVVLTLHVPVTGTVITVR